MNEAELVHMRITPTGWNRTNTYADGGQRSCVTCLLHNEDNIETSIISFILGKLKMLF